MWPLSIWSRIVETFMAVLNDIEQGVQEVWAQIVIRSPLLKAG
jgi:hypothetical protein